MTGEQDHPLQVSTPKPERRQFFISYSHREGGLVERVRKMLRPLEQRYGLECWDDSRIQMVDLWREEIERALASARVALRLVRADFLASDFVTRRELPPLIRGARKEGLCILWVPLSPCLWKLIPEIEQYQAVIPPGRTLAEMAEVENERAFVQIVETILSAFQEDAERQEAERKEDRDPHASSESQEATTLKGGLKRNLVAIRYDLATEYDPDRHFRDCLQTNLDARLSRNP